MITRVLAAGLLAGLFAGLAVATLQNFTTTPLILAAEVFEKADEAKPTASLRTSPVQAFNHDGARLILVHADHDGHGAAVPNEWEPQDGLERTIYASTATVATGIGFAFLLLAGMLTAGDGVDERRGMVWAAAGFVVTGLAPGLGLSPELPGIAAADLVSRQGWWMLTAVLTAAALWLYLRAENVWLRLLALPLLVAPHVIGAPHLTEASKSSVPPELAAQFATNSLAVHATLWVLTGIFVGLLWRRLGHLSSAGAT